MGEIFDDDSPSGFRVADVLQSFILLNYADTPVQAMVKKGRKPRHSQPQWPLRKLGTPRNTPVADGINFDRTTEADDSLSNKFMLTGRAQKIRRGISVGDIAEETTEQHGGVSSLFKDEVKTQMMELKQDMELIICGVEDSGYKTVSGRPVYNTRGIGKWLGCPNYTATGYNSATPDTAPDSNVRTPSASRVDCEIAALDEDTVRGVLASIRTTSKIANSNLTGVCTAAAKMKFADWARSGSTASSTAPLRRFNAPAKAKELYLNIDFYQGDFGRIKLLTHDFLPTATANQIHMYLLNMDYLTLYFVRNPRFTQMPDMDGGPNGVISTTFVNGVDNPQAHGVIYDGD